MTKRKAVTQLCLFVIATLLGAATTIKSQETSLRQRLSVNADWRFQKDDPTGSEGLLNYDKIKDWVTATGNEFVEPNARKRLPASENLGGSISYTKLDFDDRGWRRLDLPHD